MTLTLVYAVVPCCHFSPTFESALPYLLSCFALAFLLPLVGSTAFYGSLLWTLVRQQSRRTAGRPLPVVRIGATSGLVTLFYFVCFGPYWLLTVAATRADDEHETATNKFVRTMLLVHWLPLLNCSVNWIFYGVMNRELQRSFRRSHRQARCPSGAEIGRQVQRPVTLTLQQQEHWVISENKPLLQLAAAPLRQRLYWSRMRLGNRPTEPT